MQLIRLFLLLFLTFPFMSRADLVNKIEINGLEQISRGSVLSYMPIEAGDEINKSDLSRISNSLLKTNFFSSVKTNYSNQVLIINVIENPTIKFIDFKNYEEDLVLNKEIIDTMLKNFDLGLGKIFVESNLKKLIRSLTELYKTQAFYQTKVSIKKSIDEKNRIGIELSFDEGNPALISSMKINGSNFFNEDDLLEEFDIGEADIFIVNYFTERDHYSEKKFNAAIENLRSKYFESGFLEMVIESNEVNFSPENNQISITINIDEGPQFLFGQLNFTGDFLGQNPKKLLTFFDLDQGEVFERKKVVKGIKKIADYLQDKGYAYASLDSKMTPSKDNQIDIEIISNLDRLIYINRIEISGNTRTQDDVIRRKFRLFEGERYSKKELIESINRIKRSGYFSDVDYEIKRHVSNSDQADIVINVVETKTGEFTIGLSHTNSTGAAVTAGISQQNILGTGNVLKASFSNSKAVKDASLYFKDPYFNNLGHSISYGFFNKSIDAANLDTSSYIIDESGINFGYGVPTSTKSDFFGEFRASSIDITCGSTMLLYNEPSQCASNDDLDVNFTLLHTSDDLNDFYFPTNGSKNIIKTVLSIPGSDYQYFKFEASNKNYYPVFKDKVFKFSSRLNYGTGIGNKDLPFFKRYFEGGTSSVRGFDFNSLGAKYTDGKPKGGEVSLVSSVALGSPLDFVGLDNDNMRISAFVDAGTIAEKSSDFSLNDIRSSTGVQFTWLTPIGPIALHYALPLLKKSTDATSSFKFDLGASF